MKISCFADKGFPSQLSFQTFSISRLCNSIIKIPFLIRSIIMKKLISRFFLYSSIFLCSETLSLPTALAMNVGYGIETMVKKKNTVTKNLQVFVRNIIFLKTPFNNIPSNVNYTDLIRSRNNSEVHQTESKALRVKNIQTHGNANPFFFSTSNSLLKYWALDCYENKIIRTGSKL